MTHTEAVIQTYSLTKSYNGKPALDDLTLTVNPGEIFGYLGPNGAGKTTTIRLLMDFIRPSSGSAQIFGLDAQKSSVELRRRIGYLPSELNLWNNQTGDSILRYVARLRGGVDQAFTQSLIDRLQLDTSVRFRNYSTGNKRKLGLVMALMHQPDLLILDEPTSGLDPLMQKTFNEMMREWRDRGRTIFLSSHVLSEVQAICDRVGILGGGRLKTVESVHRLTHADFRWVTLEFREPARVDQLERAPGVSNVSVEGNRARLQLNGDFDPLLRALDGHYIVNLSVEEPTLEEIFLAYYSDQSAPVARSEQSEMERV